MVDNKQVQHARQQQSAPALVLHDLILKLWDHGPPGEKSTDRLLEQLGLLIVCCKVLAKLQLLNLL